MKREFFLKLVATRQETRRRLLELKGAAYSGNDDAFNNFKKNGVLLGLTKYQIWAVYFNKHIDSILNAIKARPDSPVDKSEGLNGRIDDAINYLDLLFGMLDEDKMSGQGVNVEITAKDAFEKMESPVNKVSTKVVRFNVGELQDISTAVSLLKVQNKDISPENLSYILNDTRASR